MVLRYGEYRESVDIEFLVSKLAGFRQLRQVLTGPDGINAITLPGRRLSQARDMRADRYGIRTLLQVDGVPIKFEVVLEARITLQDPAADDCICGVATLASLDMAAAKLLANADRWRDDSTFSRDLIDLAMMAPARRLLEQATAKAQSAYGDAVQAALVAAVAELGARPRRLQACMQALQVSGVTPAGLWARIKALRPRPAS